MLVLTRKVGEQVVIGDAVTVTVIQIYGGQVRLGVTAPKNIRVDRDEIHQRRLVDACPQRPQPYLVGKPMAS